MKITTQGRICLFGDHQDYLNLPVIACAINKYIKINGVENNSMNLIFRIKKQNKNAKKLFPPSSLYFSLCLNLLDEFE